MRPAREYSTGQELPMITQAEQFDFDYPSYLFTDIPKRSFWREALLLHYPIADQRT